MKARILIAALAVVVLQATAQEKDLGTSVADTIPNVFFSRDVPTFVVGTGGDESANRSIAAQAEFVRNRFFKNASLVLDASIDAEKGAAAWPSNAIVYGGPHENRLLERLASSLPFEMERGKLTVGDRVFEGDNYWLITVIPARAKDALGPGYPEFLLYAGTGSPGVTEINSVFHGGDPILVAETGDRLLAGKWKTTANGQLEPIWFGQDSPPSVGKGLSPSNRVESWREDLRLYAKELWARHKDFDKLICPNEFARQVAALESAVPELSDQEIVLRLMCLTASLRVAHTSVGWPNELIQFDRLPLTLRWFPDGLWVTGVADRWREALGARVVRVGSMTPDQIKAALASYIAHENEAWLLQCIPQFIIVEEILRKLDLAELDGCVPFTFVNADGTNFTLRLSTASLKAADGSSPKIENLAFPPLLSFKHPQKAYWFEHLPDTKTLYVQYNRCANDPAESFENFTKRLFAFADSHEIAGVIVDLRFNLGGNSEIIKPLINGLRDRPGFAAKGQLYGLIGPRTFSSGLFAARDLRNLGARLVGRPTGGKPNSYGDVKFLKLPNSRLRVGYSTKYFQRAEHGNPDSLEPDILIQQTFAEFMAGHDPVLEKVLTLLAPAQKTK